MISKASLKSEKETISPAQSTGLGWRRLGSLKTPVNGSKLVLNLSLLFSKVCCSNFWYQAGLPSINVWLITCYANLTSTYHPY